jgi:tetratricopeptide (TPR) repeat protein
VLWMHASSAARFDHSVRDILGLLKIHGRQSRNADLYELLRSWLVDTRGRRWLLILDNADEAEYLLEPPAVTNLERRSIPAPSGDRRLDYIPTCDHGTVLITTRRHDMCLEMVHRNDMLEVLPMDADHALELMQKKIGMQGQEDEIMRLATDLELMPLAMAQAAAYIHKRAPRCSVQQYAAKLRRSQRSRLSLLSRDETDLRRDREASNSIISTWQISFEHLRNVRPSAADLLSFMSFFDRQAIPEALLLASTTSDSDDVGENGDNALSDSESDSGSRTDALDEDILLLRDYSFISVTSDPAIFEMHALVQLATQKWLGGNTRYSEWRNKFIQVLDSEYAEIGSSDWPKGKALIPHAFAALQLDAAGTYAQPLLASLLFNAGHYAYWTHGRANAERLWITSLRISTQLFGEKDSRPRFTMYRLAWAYYDQMRMDKAEQLFLHLLSLTESLQRQHRTDLSKIDVMSGLSSMYQSQERLEEAEQLSLQVLELADDHKDTMVELENLATVYHLQERWEEAEQLLLRAVKIGTESYGSDAVLTLEAMNALGLLYKEQGRLQEAERTLSRVQEGRQIVLGSDDLATLKNMSNLGVVFQKQGRLDEAELALSRVQKSMINLFGIDHQATKDNMRCLAALHQEQGRLDEAKELYAQIVEWQRSTIGMDHRETLKTRELLWYVEVQQGLSDATIVSAKTLLDAKTRVLGVADLDTLNTMQSLAWVSYLLGKKRSATDLMVKCSALSSETLGPSDPLRVERNFAARHWEAGEWMHEKSTI